MWLPSSEQKRSFLSLNEWVMRRTWSVQLQRSISSAASLARINSGIMSFLDFPQNFMHLQCLAVLSPSFVCLRYVAYKTAELSPEALTGDISKKVWQEVAWTKARSAVVLVWCLCSAIKFEVSKLHPLVGFANSAVKLVLEVTLQIWTLEPLSWKFRSNIAGFCGHFNSHYSSASNSSENAVGR